MGRYKVTHGQSLYDVALHIYGSIEGITDLLMNNESLSLCDRLKAGDELLYSDNYIISKDVVAGYQSSTIVPASGERSVYPKYPTLTKSIELYTSNALSEVSFRHRGSGQMEVDWGDNSPLQAIEITDVESKTSHVFDSKVARCRKIVIYTDCSFKLLDLSELKPTALYILKPIYVERFHLSKVILELTSLPMLRGVFELHLNGVETENLQLLVPLTELKELILTGYQYRQPTIDSYLIGLVENFGTRRSCNITTDTEPSPLGMEAIKTILNEPEWNYPSKWQFNITDGRVTDPFTNL